MKSTVITSVFKIYQAFRCHLDFSRHLRICIEHNSVHRLDHKIGFTAYKSLHRLTWTIFVISCISMTPFPSTSYILKAHFNFSSGVPLDVTSIANKNSWKRKHNSLIKIETLLRWYVMKKFHRRCIYAS